ncbi:MAG: Ca2+-binding RTX toxin-like protein, partial [Verrucomicrobiales bacterium]
NSDDAPLNGYIFDVDTSNLGDTSIIRGNLWEDDNSDGNFDPFQTSGMFLVPYEGLRGLEVLLLDEKHNIVDQVSTGFTGDYTFRTYPGKYLVQVSIPDGWTEAINTTDDIPVGWTDGAILLSPINGRTFQVVDVADGETERLQIELVEGVAPAGSEHANFSQPIYVVDQGTEDTLAVISLSRTNALTREAVVYQTSDGTAMDGEHYNSVQGTLYFEIGEFAKSFVIPILAGGFIAECGTVELHMTLLNVTGRLINEVDLEIQHFLGGETDNDTIDGGDDWDIILGDSGNIPGNLHPGRFPEVEELLLNPGVIPAGRLDPYQVIKFSGSPGSDAINGGKSFDYIFGQGFDDFITGYQGKDYIDADVGNDYIIAEFSNDAIQGGPGFDKLFAEADADFEIFQDNPQPETDTLNVTYHANNNLDVFTLQGIDHIQLVGGNAANNFLISDWDGYLEIEGKFGRDSIEVINDTDMTIEGLTSSSNTAQVLQDIGSQLSLVKGSLGLSAGGADVTEAVNLVANFPVSSTSSLNMFAQVVSHKLFNLSGFIFNNTKSALTLGNGSLYSLASIEDAHLIGGPGANTIDASNYDGDVIFEGLGGNDNLIGGSGDDTFIFYGTEIGTTKVTGNGSVAPPDTDIDTIDFSAVTTPIVLDLEIEGVPQVVTGSLSLEIVRTDIDNLIGGQANDLLKGNALDNELTGGPGSDELHGRDGSETYAFDADSVLDQETIIETGTIGYDIISFAGTDADITIDLSITTLQTIVSGNLQLTVDASGIEELVGGNGDDHITGNALNNVLRGGSGNDTLFGLAGDDFLDGGDGNDYQNGGDGTGDFIDETANADFELTDTHIFRGSEIDVLVDIEEALLTGGSSANIFTLTGWTGDATIVGAGHGSDRLVFAANADFSILDDGADDIAILVDHAPADSIPDQTITLTTVEQVDLSGGSEGNSFDASALTDGSSTLQRASFTFFGLDGDDTFFDSPWIDTLHGGPGTDTINVTRDARLFYLASDNIVVDVNLADTYQEDNYITEIENVNVTGGPSNNIFNITNWLSGDVTIDGLGHTSGDQIQARVDGSATISDGAISLPGGTGTFSVSNVEIAFLIGGPGDDVLDFSGFSGNGIALGQAGNDTVIGGSGNDFLRGGPGDDQLTGNAGDDNLNGNQGDDTYLFAADTALDTDTITDDGGIDTLNFSGTLANNLLVRTNLVGTQTVNGFLKLNLVLVDFIENLIGGGKDDTLRGNNLDNRIEGGPGDDQLDGRAGNDTLIGGTGDDLLEGKQDNDIYLFDADDPLIGMDTINEISGMDTIDYSSTTTIGVSIDLGDISLQIINANHQLTITSATAIEILIGGAKDDVLRGNSLNNTITGGAGPDTIDGGGGINTISEVADADFVLTDDKLITDGEIDVIVNIQEATLRGGIGNNLLDASLFTLGSVRLIGDAGDDILFGGAKDDDLDGNEGDDLLMGGDGNDELDGSVGDDTYDFDVTGPQGVDTILEVEGQGLDTISGLDPLVYVIDTHIATPQVIDPNLTLTILNEDPLTADAVIEAVTP